MEEAKEAGFTHAHYNEGDVKTTRNLKENTLLVVSQERLMRGFDYRTADGIGIDLLIARNFTSKRAFVQGLNRVGRYNEAYGQFILAGIKPFSNSESLRIVANVRKRIVEMKNMSRAKIHVQMEEEIEKSWQIRK